MKIIASIVTTLAASALLLGAGTAIGGNPIHVSITDISQLEVDTGANAAAPDSPQTFARLRQPGLASGDPGGAGLPARMAPFMALIEALPHALTEHLLTELIARAVEPHKRSRDPA